MPDLPDTDRPAIRSIDRRVLITGAAWTVPVIALAVAAPAASASPTELGAYSLRGTCGVVGIRGPGFLLTASGTAPLPVGTAVLVTVTGARSAGTFSSSPNAPATFSETRLSTTSTQLTLTSELPAGATIDFRSTLSTTTAWTMRGETILPSDYRGTGAKTTASVVSGYTSCTAD